VGRDPLLADVVKLVRTTRLVTLTGVGGVGKTRLALEAGVELAAEFPDGVWIVELAQVGDHAAVPAAVAAVLGIAPRGDRLSIEMVAEALAGRRLLLVMDNCEHVLSAAAETVAAILAHSGAAKVLATSRECLWVAGEQRVPVPPLGVGDVASPAVRLYVERARSARPDFALDQAETADAVIEICSTLDGLPLGIELAAARMASMSATEVRDRLDNRFLLLTGSPQSPARQQTLREMVGWSYDLLGDDERALLRDTSVFMGGFDLASLGGVVEGADDVALLTIIDSLVRKSLVVVDHASRRSRYSLLETVRNFAQEQLAVTAGDRLRDRHAAYFGREAAARWEHWNGPAWRSAVDWVEAELGNLRAAFRWSAARGNMENATDVAAHAALMGTSVQLFETVGWAEELLEAAAAADVPRLPRLYTAAGYACFTGRPAQAAANAHHAVELEAKAGYAPCEPGLASFVEALGHAYSGHLDHYVALTRAVASLPGPARAYGLAGLVDGLQASGHVDEANGLAEEAVAAAREIGNPFWTTYALWTAGLALSHTDTVRALWAWDEAVAFARQHRVEFFEGFLARDAARLHTANGDPDTALTLFGAAVESFRDAGNTAQLIITLACLPALFEHLERSRSAAILAGAVTRQPASLNHVPELADLIARLAATLGPDPFAELSAAGERLDLNDAAAYAREQIELTRIERLTSLRSRRNPADLTRRELEVLRLAAQGHSIREISKRLFIAEKTADNHIQHIYTKIGVSSRAAATRWAIEHDL
jgi:predicted ATPase/DNA-binding CsgD family transcriptional regulator